MTRSSAPADPQRLPAPVAAAIVPSSVNASRLSQASTSLSLQVRNVEDLRSLAAVFAASGFFGKGARDRAEIEARCCVQLLAGMEAGFTPFASITGIYLVEGKPGFSAQLLAQAIKRHPSYDYRVREKTAQACSIEFFDRGESLGVETFTMEMAHRAGLAGRGPWRSYPEAMLFSRAISAGMRTHCPDALGGHAAYTPEEIGGDRFGAIDENGMVTVEVVDQPPAVAARPAEQDRDTLQARVIGRLKSLGVTPAGVKTLLRRAGGDDCTTIGQLSDAALEILATGTIPPERVADWNAGVLMNAGADEQEEPEQPTAEGEWPQAEGVDDKDETPALWAMSEPDQDLADQVMPAAPRRTITRHQAPVA